MRASVPRYLLVLLALGCTPGDAFAPGDVAGLYSASTFNLVHGADTTDVLAAGGRLIITLTPSGETSGQLTVPASLNGGTEFVADMAGTFAISGNTVHFVQSEDTFVRDLTFAIGGDGPVVSLTGSATFSDTTINVVLTRGGVLVP